MKLNTTEFSFMPRREMDVLFIARLINEEY